MSTSMHYSSHQRIRKHNLDASKHKILESRAHSIALFTNEVVKISQKEATEAKY